MHLYGEREFDDYERADTKAGKDVHEWFSNASRMVILSGPKIAGTREVSARRSGVVCMEGYCWVARLAAGRAIRVSSRGLNVATQDTWHSNYCKINIKECSVRWLYEWQPWQSDGEW